jgi:hypothetical protein
MQEGPVRAQERFHELDATLYRVGFKPRAEQPGSQAWTARLMWKSPILLLSFIFVWVAALFWIWRKVMKHRIEVTFEPDASGTKVTLTGRAGGSICSTIDKLGREGHWPENMEDRDWVPTTPADPYAEWEDEADPQEMDRITRRALKKAGRLP